jgi:8-oxo-dGTP pyrophosphatase MutT (NUDIX family)
MLKVIDHLRKNEENLPGFQSHLKLAPYRSTPPNFNVLSKDSREAAISILLYENGNKLMFPLIKRPVYEGSHSGQISFPGGKREPTDRDLLHTAIRETEEEIGIPSKQISPLHALSKIYIPPSRFIVNPFLMYSEETLSFKADEIEVEEILEVNIEDLLDDRNLKQTKLKHGDNLIINTPYFDLNDQVVWGATAMILSEFKDLLKNES